jgi:hypothetical protein
MWLWNEVLAPAAWLAVALIVASGIMVSLATRPGAPAAD